MCFVFSRSVGKEKLYIYIYIYAFLYIYLASNCVRPTGYFERVSLKQTPIPCFLCSDLSTANLLLSARSRQPSTPPIAAAPLTPSPSFHLLNSTSTRSVFTDSLLSFITHVPSGNPNNDISTSNCNYHNQYGLYTIPFLPAHTSTHTHTHVHTHTHIHTHPLSLSPIIDTLAQTYLYLSEDRSRSSNLETFVGNRNPIFNSDIRFPLGSETNY